MFLLILLNFLLLYCPVVTHSKMNYFLYIVNIRISMFSALDSLYF